MVRTALMVLTGMGETAADDAHVPALSEGQILNGISALAGLGGLIALPLLGRSLWAMTANAAGWDGYTGVLLGSFGLFALVAAAVTLLYWTVGQCAALLPSVEEP